MQGIARFLRIGVILLAILAVAASAALARGRIATRPAGEASLVYLPAIPDGAAQAGDCAAIQVAIDSLPLSGGQVNLSTGVYTCATALVIAKDHVALRGQGPGTVLRLADGANAPVLVLGETSTPVGVTHRHIHVADLFIDGNRQYQTLECWGGPCDGGGLAYIRNNGLTLRGVQDVVIENVTVRSAISGGLVTEKGCRRVSVENFTAFDNQFDGLAGYETEDSRFTGLALYDNLAAGISLDIGFNHNLIGDGVIRGNGSVGIFMIDAHNNLLHDLQIRDNKTHGIFLAEGSSPAITAAGNTFSDLIVSGSGQRANPATEGFCVDGFVGGVGLCLNNPSNVDNMLSGAQFIHNRGGCLREAAPGLLEQFGVICR